MHTETITN